MRIPWSLVLALVVVLVVAACSEAPTSPYSLTPKGSGANETEGANVLTVIRSVNYYPSAHYGSNVDANGYSVDTVWTNTSDAFTLSWVVDDTMPYAAGVLDTAVTTGNGTAALDNGEDAVSVYPGSPHYDDAQPTLGIMSRNGGGGFGAKLTMDGVYIRAANSDTIGNAWASIGATYAHFVVIFTTKCTDDRVYYTPC